MSGKSDRRIRKEVNKYKQDQLLKMREEKKRIIADWMLHVKQSSFKTRLKIAMEILKKAKK